MATDVNFGTQQYFGFDPRSINGCSLWLDAADTRTLTTNGSGNVTQWADKSITGATMTPLGTQSNATLQANYQNGLTAVNFSGINVYRTPTNTGVYPSDVYILVALKSLVRMDVIAIGSTGVDNFNSLTFGEHTALRWHNGSSGFARTPLTVAPANETSTSLLLMNWSIANNNFVIRRNGTQLSSTASYTYTLTAPSGIQIGLRHLDQTTTTLPLNAYIAEVVTFNRQLGLSERQQVEGYLAWKWGLTSSLPASHAYKTNPPAMRIFQPVDVDGGALLWLDAADTRTVTGTSPVTLWNDKSGQGWNATSTGALGTVTTGTALNSQNTIRFAASTSLNISNVVMPSTQTSVFYVFRGITSNTSGGGTGYFIFSRTADNFAVYTGNEQFASYQNQSAGRSYVLVMGPGGERNWGNLSTTAFSTGTNVIATTGVSYASSNGLSLPLVRSDNVSNSVFTATTYQIGTSRSCCGDVFTFDLGELVVYDGTTSTVVAQQIEGYLAWKWGVQRSLPTTHPYYGLPPNTPLFTPTLMSNCVFWIDAADRSTVTSNASSVVTAVTDKSASGSNITNAMTTSGFTWNITKFNSIYPSFYYNSTQNITLGSNSTITVSQPATVFTVQQLVGSASFQDVFDSTNSGNRMFAFYFVPSTANYRIFAGTTLFPATNAVTTPAIYSYYFNGTSSQIFENGTSTVSGDAGTQGSTGITIGSRWTQNQETFQGHIAEVIYYNRRLSRSERQTVEGYLAWKWGLQLNLPSTHPYQNFRP
jgi:hypothetical protein